MVQQITQRHADNGCTPFCGNLAQCVRLSIQLSRLLGYWEIAIYRVPEGRSTFAR